MEGACVSEKEGGGGSQEDLEQSGRARCPGARGEEGRVGANRAKAVRSPRTISAALQLSAQLPLALLPRQVLAML